jgi:hypothetical protein
LCRCEGSLSQIYKVKPFSQIKDWKSNFRESAYLKYQNLAAYLNLPKAHLNLKVGDTQSHSSTAAAALKQALWQLSTDRQPFTDRGR